MWFSEGITELCAGLFDLLKQNIVFLLYLIRCILLLQHEEGSVQMFEHMLEKNGLHNELVDCFPTLNGRAVLFIKELIKGEGTLFGNKKYLYQVYVLDFLYEVCICFASVFNESAEMVIHRTQCLVFCYIF